MANDVFGGLGNLGGLGGILGGIAKSVVPKDTPEGKLLNAQRDFADLQRQESELLLEIGKAAYAQNPSAWPLPGMRAQEPGGSEVLPRVRFAACAGGPQALHILRDRPCAGYALLRRVRRKANGQWIMGNHGHVSL
ncbi:hypothetical protein FACS189415_1250 [Bacteroidia bacterium]|nr:hypothetical protein FACS189415_1250 [Bacteroidia bacterium]